MPHIPEGTYRARPISLTLTESKNGNPMIQGIFEPVDMVGTNLYWNGMLTEKSRDNTFKSLRTCGWTGTDLTSITFPADIEVHVVVENEDYNGKPHSKVRWVNSTHGKKVESAMAPDKAKAFAEAMKGAIYAFDQKNPGLKRDNTNTTEPLPF